MEISKKDLRKMSRGFRGIASRLIRAHYDDADLILRMFVDYIDNNQLISSYICSMDLDDFDVANEVNTVLSGHGRKILRTGSCGEEEVVFTYAIFKHMIEEDISVLSIGRSYSMSGKFQDHVRGFGNRVVLPFVRHIEEYFADIAIDMGYDDEETRHVITVHGGQVNIAKDQATITAAQYNGIDVSELDNLVGSIKALLFTDATPPEVRESINDNVEVIQKELKRENPKKGSLMTAVNGLRGVLSKLPEAVRLAAAIKSIIELAMAASQ